MYIYFQHYLESNNIIYTGERYYAVEVTSHIFITFFQTERVKARKRVRTFRLLQQKELFTTVI